MTSTDERELLELAAVAAGISGQSYWGENPIHRGIYTGGRYWNPLTDDGDCARLETAVGLTVDIGDTGVISGQGMLFEVLAMYKDHDGDRNKARRFASVSAAAEIGRKMP